MYDNLLYNFNETQIGDTLSMVTALKDSCTIDTLAQNNFIELGNLPINPMLYSHNLNDDIITFVVITLIGIVSVVWYLLPERFLSIFSLKSIKQIQRDGNSASNAPGLIITSLFWIIFIVSVSAFLFLFLHRFFYDAISEASDYQVFKYIIVVISSLFVFRYILIYTTAFIFQTGKMMKQQVITDRNIQLITGILLLPIILIVQYANGDILIYAVIASLLILQAYRLIQIAIIGNSSSVFSAFHIILYLCALEIVPILVLLRLINFDLYL